MVPARLPFLIGKPGCVNGRAPGSGSSRRPREPAPCPADRQIETDDIADLLDEVLVIRQLEGLHQVRLEAVRLPDPMHAGVGLWPTARAILRMLQCVAAGGVSCKVLCTDRSITLGAQRRLAPGRVASRRVQSGDALRRKVAAPASLPTVTLLLPTNRTIVLVPIPSADSQHDPCPPRSFCGVFRPRNQRLPASRRPRETARCTANVFVIRPQNRRTQIIWETFVGSDTS